MIRSDLTTILRLKPRDWEALNTIIDLGSGAGADSDNFYVYHNLSDAFDKRIGDAYEGRRLGISYLKTINGLRLAEVTDRRADEQWVILFFEE